MLLILQLGKCVVCEYGFWNHLCNFYFFFFFSFTFNFYFSVKKFNSDQCPKGERKVAWEELLNIYIE